MRQCWKLHIPADEDVELVVEYGGFRGGPQHLRDGTEGGRDKR